MKLKNPMKKAAFLFLSLFVYVAALAQTSNENQALKVNDRVPVAGSEKTDLIFTRTFFAGTVEGVDFDGARSGSYSLGVGYGIPIGNSVEIKLEPRATWQKLVFREFSDTTKYFPSSLTGSEMIYEKLRAFYVEVPVGVKLKLARNAENKYKLLLEGGFSFGFNAGSTFKSRFSVDADSDPNDMESRATVKVNNFEGFNSLRYGPYGRIGTNWISIYGFYRLSDVFDDTMMFNTPSGDVAFPKFPQLELGLSIII